MDPSSFAALMTVIVSVIAVGLSGWSIVYARRAARVAAGAELRASTPKLTGTLVTALGGGRHLRILNEAPIDLDHVTVELVLPRSFDEPSPVTAISAVQAITNPGEAVDLGPLKVGETHDLALWRNSPLRGEMRCRCHCRAGKHSWVVLIRADLTALG